jgi:hypothetical protein
MQDLQIWWFRSPSGLPQRVAAALLQLYAAHDRAALVPPGASAITRRAR